LHFQNIAVSQKIALGNTWGTAAKSTEKAVSGARARSEAEWHAEFERFGKNFFAPRRHRRDTLIF